MIPIISSSKNAEAKIYFTVGKNDHTSQKNTGFLMGNAKVLYTNHRQITTLKKNQEPNSKKRKTKEEKKAPICLYFCILLFLHYFFLLRLFISSRIAMARI